MPVSTPTFEENKKVEEIEKQSLCRISKEDNYRLWKKLVDDTIADHGCKYCQIYKCIDKEGNLFYNVVGINENAEITEVRVPCDEVIA